MPVYGNVTAYIGKLPQEGDDLFILWNYMRNKVVTVQVVGYAANQIGDEVDQERTARECNHYVGLIHSLIETIDFDLDESCAYMIQKPSGPRIIQRRKPYYRIPCDFLWAPRVDISEIEVQSIWSVGHGRGRGVWRGKQVDISMACDEGGLIVVEGETRNLKAMQGMDLTYNIVAHVFRGDALIGLLTESSRRAQPFKFSDRAAVFAAFAKLERAFMIYYGLDSYRIYIDQGRVKLVTIANITYYAPHERENFEALAQEWHWDILRDIFSPPGCAPGPITIWYPDPTPHGVLARTPPPERILFITLDFSDLGRISVEGEILDDEGQDTRRRKKKSTGAKTKLMQIGSLTKAAQSHGLAVTRFVHPPPPYSRSLLPHERLVTRRLLLAQAPAESTSVDSQSSIVEL
ncbi:hypothetical protein B0H15DRAFT_834093 [Mycena belliarum]|uniref:Uncharacterized protein n=1 Tax=Mycena belliarum TaxID=1033014 RepID=A0AAD6U9A3_9AGAR|nr:hypothetical protein B0H15DRAFT_834093 [Mycena belliae]